MYILKCKALIFTEVALNLLAVASNLHLLHHFRGYCLAPLYSAACHLCAQITNKHGRKHTVEAIHSILLAGAVFGTSANSC